MGGNQRLTWLVQAPLISMLDLRDTRAPKPITWAQQRILLPKLSAHAAEMALFVLNTGARDAAACSPRWDWEVRSPDQRYSIFVVPKDAVINGKGKVRDAVKGRRPTTTRWHRSTSWWTRWNSLPTSTAG